MDLTLVPAYGRDYKSVKATTNSWKQGDDWIIANITHKYDGKPVSIRDTEALKEEGYSHVNLRFKFLTSITVVKL